MEARDDGTHTHTLPPPAPVITICHQPATTAHTNTHPAGQFTDLQYCSLLDSDTGGSCVEVRDLSS